MIEAVLVVIVGSLYALCAAAMLGALIEVEGKWAPADQLWIGWLCLAAALWPLSLAVGMGASLADRRSR